jgi:hypothetical protein
MVRAARQNLFFCSSIWQKDRAVDQFVASLNLLVDPAQQSTVLATRNSLGLEIF